MSVRLVEPKSRDNTHAWANYIVGLHIPRWWLRGLSPAKFDRACQYIAYIWLTANDNIVRKVERPKWFPKKFIWGQPRKGKKK